ncbi:MAG: hypothetical protein KIT56_03815 [Gammaproteobacteria bacterium]|nr:hypothetical protein [Gammaproteobacteria bacterium]MCW5583003.1 hypothetical protein [Gammaproteobacteria bacterium]
MLRKVEKYKTTDWESGCETLRTHLGQFRNEIKEIQDKEQAITAIAKLDHLVSLPAVMKILNEIREINENVIRNTFSEMTGKDINKTIIKGSIREVIAKILDSDTRKIFEKLADESRMAELTEEKIKHFFMSIVKQIYDRGIKRYLLEEVVLETAEQVFTQLFCNEVFLICTIELYMEADKRQTANWFQIVALMAPYLAKAHKEEAIQNPFIIVREYVKLVRIDEATSALWQEVALWLEGMNRHVYLQVPEQYRKDGGVMKNENNKMPTISDKDKSFQDKFNLTLYEMSLFYHQISAVIQAHLVPKPVLQPVTVKQPTNEEEISKQSGTPFPTDKQEIMFSHSAGLQLFQCSRQSHHIKGEKPLLSSNILDKIQAAKEETAKFTMLLVYLTQYKLSKQQNLLLKEFSDVIIETLKGYIAASFSSHYVPTILRSRSHAQIVKETIKYIEEADTPADQLTLLLQLWKNLNGKGSTDLEPKVVELIRSACTILSTAAMQTDEEEKKITQKL